MVSLLVSSICLLPVTFQTPAAIERQVVGTWIYDTKSVIINLNAAAQKQVAAAGSKGVGQLEQMKSGLAEIVGRMTLVFLADHRFIAEIAGVKEKNMGHWSIRDRDIIVLMDKKDQRVPKMAIGKDFKRITTIYEEPTLGQGLVDMIRKG